MREILFKAKRIDNGEWAGTSVLMRLQEEWINGMCKEM